MEYHTPCDKMVADWIDRLRALYVDQLLALDMTGLEDIKEDQYLALEAIDKAITACENLLSYDTNKDD